MQEKINDTATQTETVIDYSKHFGFTEEKSQDPVELLKTRAIEKLKKIGIPSIPDILDALKDKDDQGNNLTIAEFRINYMDLEKGEVTHGKSMFLTMAPQVSLEKSGAYNTVTLQFPHKKSAEMNRLWSLLSDYGAEMAQYDVSTGEFPLIGLTVLPMTLGGQYGMIATDPIFYHLQPSSPMDQYCDQIRLLFEPEAVMFMRNDSFKSDEVLETVKMELAAERLKEEALVKAQLEKEEFQKEHEAEIQSYLDHNKYDKRGFRSSKGSDGSFKTREPFKEGFRTSTQTEQKPDEGK
ncbi:hypothetical protein [Clostridium porci]|uniref:Uncharacterized protein n=1 Tax=Clostridium porci TaxID=2605778 RepID=A0A7X2TDF9_9CLOT|nr:hypothetical protein [Clostridium porci]MSS38019.1 hypothetical protein [Clostridium porci]